MNKQRRKEINAIIIEISQLTMPDHGTLGSISMEIENILMDEQLAFESMPEGLQYSMRGETSQEAQDNLQEAMDTIDEFVNDWTEEEIEDEKAYQKTMKEILEAVVNSLESAMI